MRVINFVRDKPRTSAEIMDYMQGTFRVNAEKIQGLRRMGLIKFDRSSRRWRLS
jgi:hypothetical protein